MLFTHLSEKFYNDYPAEKYPEMMLKENRPYTQVITDVNGLRVVSVLVFLSLLLLIDIGIISYSSVLVYSFANNPSSTT